MGEVRYVNTETNVERNLTEAQAKQFSGVKSRTGGPLWKPKSGKVLVNVKDAAGNSHVRHISADAYHQNQQLGNKNISLIGEDSGAVFAQARVDEQNKIQAKLDDESGGTAFGINAVPFGRTIARQFLSGDVKEDSILDGMRLDAANPIAAGAGTAAQMLLTTAAMGGAIGLARTAGAALGAGGAAEGMFAAANTMKATKLFGFADDAGNFVAGRLATRGANQTLANIVGKGVSSAVLTAPASVIYEASERVDFDKKFTVENFAADVGVDILLGAAFDFGLPLIGKGLAKAGGIGLGSVGLVAAVAGGSLRKLSYGIRAVRGAKRFTRNSASKAVGGEVLDEAADIAAKRSAGVNDLRPSKVMSRQQTVKVKEALDGLGGSTGIDAGEIARASENIGNLAGLRKGVGNFQTVVDEVADTMVGHLEGLTVKTKLQNAGDLRIDIALNASELRNALGDTLTDKGLLQRIDDLMDLGPGTSRRESVTRALRFRNSVMVKVAKGELNPSVAAAVRKHIDNVLTDASVTGPGSTELKRLISASDAIVDMAPSMKSLAKDLQNLDNIVDITPAGGVGTYLDEMGAAYDEIVGLGGVSGNDARFVRPRLSAGQSRLEKIIPDLETAATVNKVRNKLAGEGGTILHAPTGAAAGEKLTAAQVEANVRFTVRMKEMVGKVLKSPQAKIGLRGGVFKYRQMKTYAEKLEAFEVARDAILAATASPDSLQRTAQNMIHGLQGDPELAGAMAVQSIQTVQYLRNFIPEPPSGVVPVRSNYASPAEVTGFLEILGAADDPLSVMAAALEGNLNESSLSAVETLFPSALADMRVEVSAALTTDDSYFKLSYKQRLTMDSFLGGGYEPSASPAALITFQNRSAQTQAQERSLRGDAAMRQPQAGASSNSDRLANF